jgi:hypothetical protein
MMAAFKMTKSVSVDLQAIFLCATYRFIQAKPRLYQHLLAANSDSDKNSSETGTAAVKDLPEASTKPCFFKYNGPRKGAKTSQGDGILIM